MSLVLITRTSCTFANASNTIEANASSEGTIATTAASSIPWQHDALHHPHFVVATVDGSIMVLHAQTGALVQVFPSGLALVGPSSTLPSGRRIVPGLDGRLYVTTLPEEEKASGANILRPLEITVIDVLQNPVKTCSDADHSECGIVTATKSSTLFALDSRSGHLIWHQSPNGTTVQHQSQSSSTVILQREDVMVQQISTDSGLSVWNVTLGTFQALEFGGDSSQGENEDDSFLPGQGPRSSSSSRNLLLQPPPSQPTASATAATLLPSVMFGSDGTTLTAVDPEEGTSLWKFEFTTVVASVFGLNGKSWKPLTVLEAPATESSSQPKALEPGDSGVALYRPPSYDQMFVQNERYLEHLDWLYKQSQEKPPYQHQSPFPPIREAMQSRRHTMPNFLLWGGNSDRQYGLAPTNTAQLALPSPDDLLHFPNPDLRSDGLFLTWPVIAAILCVAVTIVQRWYKRKKKQWYLDFEAKAEMTLVATSTDVTQGLIEPEPGSKPVRFLMHNQSTINLRRTLSVPGVDQPPPGPPQVQNVSMTWVQPPHADGAKSQDPASPANFDGDNPQPTASPTSPSLLPVDKPQQEQGVGFLMDGIPLIRYPRYDSEFKEITALGKGGFGTVFQVQNVLDGRVYAIKKVILKSDSRLPQEQFQQRLQRTLREVKSLALLDHPNIVRYYTAWLELDNNADDALVDPVAGASDYYLFSPANGVTTTNENALGIVSSTSNRYTSWRRPSLEHLKKMTDFNPLGGWDNTEQEEEIVFNHNIPGVPAELEDYGFTFERSENDESVLSNEKKETRDEGNCMALVKYPVSVVEETSRKGFFSRRSSLGSVTSSVEESQSAWSKDSGSRSIPLLKNALSEGKTDEIEGESFSVKHLLYIQMQFCSQKTLADFLCNKEARRGPSGGDCVDIPYALSLFLQIAQGVEHVHTQGLIHRDLKPNNCFIDDAGAVKVGDFGLSRESGDTRDDSNPLIDENQVEVAGDITAGVGTRSYASPEQMEGSDYDASTDVFSLGIILFELCYPMYTVCFK